MRGSVATIKASSMRVNTVLGTSSVIPLANFGGCSRAGGVADCARVSNGAGKGDGLTFARP